MDERPVINCHTHIFTGDHVPPYIAKTYVPSPLHIFLPLSAFVSLFRKWYGGPAKLRYSVANKKTKQFFANIDRLLNKVYVLKVLAGYYIFFFTFFLVYKLVTPIFPPDKSSFSGLINKAAEWANPIFPTFPYMWLNILIIVIVAAFFGTIRNIILSVASLLWKVLGKLPGKNTKEMFNRYLNIGRYAFHLEQKTILGKLKSQYPKDTGFVVLPMDMDHMDAGKSKTRYRDQMKELAEVKTSPSNKKIFYPFVFADPRRMVKPTEEIRYEIGDKEYFNYTIIDGKIVLGDCFLKEYLEEHRFSGIKIYPALGYFPFDEKLLPLWKYAADNNIPIMTHCIRGTIFYRGLKKDDWYQHPIFEEVTKAKIENHDADENDTQATYQVDTVETEYGPLQLPQRKNVDFSYNFTHPLNYLCLLEEELLRKVVKKAIDKNPQSDLKEMFGYTSPDVPLTYTLKNLKICMAHFGGDDEWKRYFEKDRYDYSSQLAKNPTVGIKFLKTVDNKPSKGKIEQIWKYVDWYSIICSMMLQYPNVYADISYILHSDQEILPLLKQTLQNPGLRKKVLYGTDFFVVRNHKSDKNMLADMTGGLSTEDFDQIAKENPRVYLQNTLPALQTMVKTGDI